MRRVMLSVLLVSAGVLCGCGKRISDNQRLNTAVDELKKNNISDSSRQLDLVLKKNPDNCSARMLQALIYERNGEDDKALDVVTQVAKDYPDSFAALYTLGRLLAKSQPRRSLAYDTLKKAHELRKDDLSTLILLCNLGTELNYRKVSVYLNALQAHPAFAGSNILHYQQGKCHLNNGRRQQALASFRAALRGCRDAALIFNVAYAIDNANLDRKYAAGLYNLYLRYPGKNGKSNDRIVHAGQRIRVLGR
ncbi:MAG: tetratricopeptide repeat protein [Lentisphaeria bacterium]|nr:tetratricopeptide repeat protein [Lentisphaeria bacterium]